MNWKKTLIITAIGVAILGLPFFLLSTPMVGYYYSCFEENPESGFNQWLVLNGAGTCFNTMRPEKALEGYNKFNDVMPDDNEDVPFVMIRIALCLEEMDKFDKALDAFDAFLAVFPEHDLADEAKQGIRRIKYVSPH